MLAGFSRSVSLNNLDWFLLKTFLSARISKFEHKTISIKYASKSDRLQLQNFLQISIILGGYNFLL